MTQIYDNIETKFTEGLQGIISNTQVKRVDFCVGYFNLRGWELVVDEIDAIDGDFLYENEKNVHRVCRLLVGMQRPGFDLIKRYIKTQTNPIPDSEEVKTLQKTDCR